MRDRPVQNSWIHNFWGYFSLLIYWAVIRIQRWTELEDIFKADEEITGKPMRLVALLQHPWNPFGVPLRQCEMMSEKIWMPCLSHHHLLDLLRDFSQKQVVLQQNSAGFVTVSKGTVGNKIVSSTEWRVGLSSSGSVSVLCKVSLRYCQR